MLSREQTLTLLGTLATVSLTAIGLKMGGAGENSIYAILMANIGMNLASNIIQAGSLNLKERWLNSRDGLLNHDIQNALGRSFVKALSSLEEKYFDSDAVRNLQRHEKNSIRALFSDFRANAQDAVPDAIERIRLGADIKDYFLRASGESSDALWNLIGGDDLLAEYGSEFQDFMRQNLLEETKLWFAEELKTDSRESNRAWRAFQRMLLEGIYADVKDLRASQDLISKDLRKLDNIRGELDRLQNTIDRRLPGEPFQAGLEQAIDKLQANLVSIAETNLRIDKGVKGISEDVKRLVEYHEGQASGRNKLIVDKRAAYSELWTRLQEVHLKLRVEDVDPEQFRTMIVEVNSFMLKQSLLLAEEDRNLAYRYLNTIFRFREALFDSDEEEGKEAWVITAPVPRDVIDSARELRKLDAEVKQLHDLIAERYLSVINER